MESRPSVPARPTQLVLCYVLSRRVWILFTKWDKRPLWSRTDVIWSPDCPVVGRRAEVVSVAGRTAGRCLPCSIVWALEGGRDGPAPASRVECGRDQRKGSLPSEGPCSLCGRGCRAAARLSLGVAAVLPLVKAARRRVCVRACVCVAGTECGEEHCEAGAHPATRAAASVFLLGFLQESSQMGVCGGRTAPECLPGFIFFLF